MSVNDLFGLLVKIIMIALIGAALLTIAGALLSIGPIGWIILAVIAWLVYGQVKENRSEKGGDR